MLVRSVNRRGEPRSELTGDFFSHFQPATGSRLQALYERYGHWTIQTRYFFCYDRAVMDSIFDAVRADGNYPTTCGEYPISYVRVVGTTFSVLLYFLPLATPTMFRFLCFVAVLSLASTGSTFWAYPPTTSFSPPTPRTETSGIKRPALTRGKRTRSRSCPMGSR